MKKRVSRRLAIALALVMLVTTVAFAAPALGEIDFSVSLKGKSVDFGESSIYLEEGRTYVPLRQMFEAAGYQVDWDNTNKAISITDPLAVSNDTTRDQKVDAALWQLSAEARACFYQAFSLATIRLDEAIAAKKSGEKLAIIADIDDTLVDGVMYTSDVLLDGIWDNEHFGKSLASDECLALPGAVEFMNYAREKGVEVFYITNRDPSLKDVTYESMKRLGFPQIDESHIFIREEGMASSKESRRDIVEKDYTVALMLGDNLEDFADLFPPKEGVDARRDAVDKAADQWGDMFIVLPNAVYGDWEKAVYNYDKEKTASQKADDKAAVFEEYKYTAD